MDILIIGSGGREHALAWKLRKSPRIGKIFIAPGNAGTALIGENVAVGVSDLPALVDFAKSRQIGLTIVGPDDALAAGIADAFAQAGLRIFGPTRHAAQLESSKSFAKDFMRRHGIPTAASHEFSDSIEAHAWCRTATYPLVIKADGLALGKGVIIAENPSAAAHAIYRCMDAMVFGQAGARIVIEEFLEGTECSLHAFVDGTTYVLCPDCRDHKRAYDHDMGPNTGGMGTISPSGSLDAPLLQIVNESILDRVVAGLRADGITYRGMLFPGIILTKDGPKVLEFNCRWGDPETQVLLRRLDSDLLDLLEATVSGTLGEQVPRWSAQHAVCVVLASGGYPHAYEKGKEIHGLKPAADQDGIAIFHAGTRCEENRFFTNGGRVLGVTALGDTLAIARDAAYHAADQISFAGLQRRSDIGVTTP